MIDHFAKWLLETRDREREKLYRAIPKYEELRTNPKAILAEDEILVESNPMRGLGVMWAIMLYMVAVTPISWLVVMLKHENPAEELLLAAYLVAVLCGFAIAAWLIPPLLPCRTMVLRLEGVLIRDRRFEVRCPWELFQSAGEVCEDENWIQIPIQSSEVSRLELREYGSEIAVGSSVQTSFFKVRGKNCIALVNRFKPRGLYLGCFLIELAWKLRSISS